MYKIPELYDLQHTQASDYLSKFTYPWEALKGIKELILQLGETLNKDDFLELAPTVWVHKTAKVAPSAYLGAPCIIGAGTEVRHCAFIRGSALVGEGCVVGNSVELKNVILFDKVQVPTTTMWATASLATSPIWAQALLPPMSNPISLWW